MAEKILELAENSNLRHTLGQAGWKRASEKFSWEIEKQSLRGLLGIGG